MQDGGVQTRDMGDRHHRVHSEVGALRSVLVCRPGLAQRRLAPAACAEMLFDGVMWVERAMADFAQFVQALTQRGVEVLELHELLAQTLDVPEARALLLQRRLAQGALAALGRQPGQELRELLDALPAPRLAELLIGGMTRAELGGKPSARLLAYIDLVHYLLPPLPNLMYMRDSSCWIGAGPRVNRMQHAVRGGEADLLEAVYRFHPRFAATRPVLPDALGQAGSIEGGDVMALGNGVVLVGVGQRTTAPAAMQLAQALLHEGMATTVIAAVMPRPTRGHAGVHLDSVFTPCSAQVVSYTPALVDRIVCHELRLAPRGPELQLRTHSGRHLLDVLAQALGVSTLRAVASSADAPEAGEQPWDDGHNVLAVDNGVVIGYDRHASTHKRLRQAGVEVIEVPGGELRLGRGGPRALVCPLAREAVSYA
jgi:arginine deiminase